MTLLVPLNTHLKSTGVIFSSLFCFILLTLIFDISSKKKKPLKYKLSNVIASVITGADAVILLVRRLKTGAKGQRKYK